jgi:hypothetical protein
VGFAPSLAIITSTIYRKRWRATTGRSPLTSCTPGNAWGIIAALFVSPWIVIMLASWKSNSKLLVCHLPTLDAWRNDGELEELLAHKKTAAAIYHVWPDYYRRAPLQMPTPELKT